MGCHTWGWVPIPISEEELLKQAAGSLTKMRKFVAKQYNYPGSNTNEWDEYLAKFESYYASRKRVSLLKLLIEQDGRLLQQYAGVLYQEVNGYNDALFGKKRYEYVDSPLAEGEDPTAWRPKLEVVNEEVYYCHDPFRVSGYPSTRLFSLKQALNYRDKMLREKPNCISWEEHSLELVTNFWKRYPKGMITFG